MSSPAATTPTSDVDLGHFRFEQGDDGKLLSILSGPGVHGYLIYDRDQKCHAQIRILDTDARRDGGLSGSIWHAISETRQNVIFPELTAHGVDDGVPYYVSKLPYGKPLRSYIKEEGSVALAQALRWMLEFVQEFRRQSQFPQQRASFAEESLWLVRKDPSKAELQIALGEVSPLASETAEVDSVYTCLTALRSLIRSEDRALFSRLVREWDQDEEHNLFRLERFLQRVLEMRRTEEVFLKAAPQPSPILNSLLPGAELPAEFLTSPVDAEEETAARQSPIDADRRVPPEAEIESPTRLEEAPAEEPEKKNARFGILALTAVLVLLLWLGVGWLQKRNQQRIAESFAVAAPPSQVELALNNSFVKLPEDSTADPPNSEPEAAVAAVPKVATEPSAVAPPRAPDEPIPTPDLKATAENSPAPVAAAPDNSSATPAEEMKPENSPAPSDPTGLGEGPNRVESAEMAARDGNGATGSDAPLPELPPAEITSTESVPVPIKPKESAVPSSGGGNHSVKQMQNPEQDQKNKPMELAMATPAAPAAIARKIVEPAKEPSEPEEKMEPVTEPAFDPIRQEKKIQQLRASGDWNSEIDALVEFGKSGFPDKLREAGERIFQMPLASDSQKAEAVEYFIAAADYGDSQAQYYAGECLVIGKGRDKDFELGTYYLQKAVDQKDDRAMDLLGVCYIQGWGVKRDPKAGAKLFQSAVDAGNTPALFNLGGRYASGEGVSQDPKKAASLFQSGAERGDAQSMAALARCLEHGFGRKKDRSAAISWYKRAANLDHPQAIKWCQANKVEW